MAFPQYQNIADALLCFIFLNGGNDHQVNAAQTYEPLADFFALTQEDRNRPRPDGFGCTLWENRVQWTRQRLINHGYAESRGHGEWGLTPEGVSRAKSIVGEFNRSKKPLKALRTKAS